MATYRGTTSTQTYIALRALSMIQSATLLTIRQTSLSAIRRFSAEAASRDFIRALLAVFTVVVLLLGQSIFWTNAISVPMRLILVGVALVSYFRPPIGLLVLAALLPPVSSGVILPLRANEGDIGREVEVDVSATPDRARPMEHNSQI